MNRSKPIPIPSRKSLIRQHLPSASLWQPDSAVSNCNLCKSSFSFLNRRHHCRKCGRIYCGNCITTGVIPDVINSISKSPVSAWNILFGNQHNECKDRKRKLCITCSHNIDVAVRDERVYKLVDAFVKSGLFSYDILCNLMTCNVAYYNACSSTQDSLCLLRQYLPFQAVKPKESNLIQSNYVHFMNTRRMDLIARGNFKLSRDVNHEDITKSLTLHRSLEILLFHTSTDKRIIEACKVYIKSKIPHILFRYKYSLMCICDFKFVFDVISRMPYGMRFDMYFHVKHIIPSVAAKIIESDEDLKEDVDISEKLQGMLIMISDTSVREKHFKIYKRFKKLIKKHTFIRFPGMFKYKVTDIRIQNVTMKSSKTSPTVIPIVYSSNGEKHIQAILIKKENIISDAIIMDCLHYIRYLSSEMSGVVITYEVVPLGRNIGAIECVNNSMTIYSIENRTTLQNFILECNEEETIISVQNKIVNSLFPQTVFTYIFGLGDRHNNNIMVTSNGEIFNIDYSTFLFGQAPTHKRMMTSKMYISQSIMNCIGENSKWHYLFNQKCQELYTRVRENLTGFVVNTYIPMMNFVGIDESVMKTHFMDRFVPSLNSHDACIAIEKLIDQSSSTVGSYRNFYERIKNALSSI